MKEALLILAGWLLGILSPFVTEKIRDSQKRVELLRTIRAELDELQHRLVIFTYKLAQHLGTRDRKLLQWVLENLKKYRGILPTEITIDAMEKLSKGTDEQLEALASHMKAPKKMSLGLKTFEIPYIDAHLGEINLLTLEQQRRIFEIRTRLHLINQEIHNANYFFRKTFSSNVSEDNARILSANIDTSYTMIGIQSREAVDHINDL